MNLSPFGYVAQHVLHIGVPQLSERELTRQLRRTWRCAVCGHMEIDTRPGQLRKRARDHARQCGQVVCEG